MSAQLGSHRPSSQPGLRPGIAATSAGRAIRSIATPANWPASASSAASPPASARWIAPRGFRKSASSGPEAVVKGWIKGPP
jgi:hypothetical protein